MRFPLLGTVSPTGYSPPLHSGLCLNAISLQLVTVPDSPLPRPVLVTLSHHWGDSDVKSVTPVHCRVQHLAWTWDSETQIDASGNKHVAAGPMTLVGSTCQLLPSR